MAKTDNLYIRIDPNTKKAAEKLFSNFGITITDAVNMFLHQSIISGGLPFRLKLDRPNAATLEAVKEIENDIKKKVPITYEQSVDDFLKGMAVHEKG